ncbi:ABC transporter ATP-binding protein [Paenibacillus aestuarii]|uniref:ABC transporter ATP-binding protein n=1 Tax=Paenibacillus aestuarii TaxID=516965 RepID=A0ABW0KG84_9BACL|nr:ABC transporter ATP-binding protein [Paenibacillus aestuarii]
MNPILETASISKQYSKGRGVYDVSLQLFEGDVYGLLGPNGAGKTTFLKLITGLIHPDSGGIQLFGVNLKEQFAQGIQHVGCMIESADFHDFLSAEQYLQLVARFYPSIERKQIDELLETVGLYTYRKERIKGYSTGMKQKLALAAAVLPRPKLAILDEPTNGLDIEGTVMFRSLVKRLSEEKRMSFIISSHMIHELEQLCNRVGIVLKGRLHKEGYVDELLQSNQSLEQFYIEELQLAKEVSARA